MSTEQRVRAAARGARDSFYRMRAEWGTPADLTNWRMLLARRFKIPVAEVRRILAGEEAANDHHLGKVRQEGGHLPRRHLR